ncbi:hypothetical protein JX265_013255 [Neoarthrinium moseri]|uniref:GDP/GTP exchange factor Sec2 N-terminal domain-containing protein n=1 Tax=Neoarthrinium moseri TaxID=1658444 RepID=A0A9P9W8K7_9PEZI|nr:uncharacterized protein JN550_005016 [Neoarthrinium moseri]KAI1851137.1 hypothetical protein JX265_013255 [Neoarthrinium moseri]KAI1851876.1 hypothetical protein JX266_002729 [Neoarthrinium moseri]KAI1870870.1 hypothetical protein JN550_005016 [Neoarthrinium moseri]
MPGDSFIHVAAWPQHQHQSPSPKPQRSFGHFRSLSSFSQTSVSSRAKSPARPPSMSQLPDMASTPESPSLDVPQPKRMPSNQSLMEDMDYSTNLDLRKSSADGTATPAHHPDLNDEVATLSTKLINAINHQTALDDTLASTRHELEDERTKVRELEEKVARQQELLAGDVWVRRSTVESEKNRLLLRVAEEKRQRFEVEKEKKKIEQELENLTTALFEEANKMVISAKEEAQKEHDAIQRKNDLLKSQLADTEGLLRSQQEQLAELKLVMEHMTAEHDDHSGTTPSSPGFSKFDSRDDDTHVTDSVSQSGITEPSSPTYPTSLTHLLQPVLRTDLAAYEDFLALVKTSKRTSSRISSGSYSGLNPLLSLASAGSAPSNASTTSLTTAGTASSNVSPQTPNTPASAISAGSVATPLPPLKETKFYKRALAEDVEPTLRLDIAPGLSWLARRSVLTSMTEGSLVVEPVPTNNPFAAISKPQFYPCSLCGESRKETPHLRMHRFRTSEADSAQRYPLCKYCLNRVRSTCDFLGFLRIVKDGHWRAEDADAERAAWEESVRLREQMFWSRIGGGVIPATQALLHPPSIGEKSPRSSHEGQTTPAPADLKRTSSSDSTVAPVSVTTPADQEHDVEQQPDKSPDAADREEAEVKPDTASPTVDQANQSLGAENADPNEDGVKRLSITIPGSFDNA